jgi:menaquinone-dependent protoporphyrinogen oxidase
MAPSILVAYATKRGSTREVAEAVAETLAEHGLDVDVRPAAEVRDLDRYDGVVLGGALYTGRWHADARRFLARHRAQLDRVPVAVFGMGPEKLDAPSVAESRKQLDRALARTPGLHPVAVAIFGGVVDPAKLHFPFSHMPASDARDWDAVEEWAQGLAAELAVPDAREAGVQGGLR